MRRDFTLEVYIEFLKVLYKKGYQFYTAKKYFETQNDLVDKYIILRHDVDKMPQNSLMKAEIEKDLGIQSTYYFRALDCSFNKKIITAIIDLGHEFGYHYEDLSLAKGDTEKAFQMFKNNLKMFRTVGPVSTICMHGSPLSKWDNRTLWKYYDYHDHNIVGEPYFDIDFSDVFYLTDTGRKWNRTGSSIRDKVSTRLPYKYKLLSTMELISLAKNNELPDKIMINTHPQRWTDNYFLWSKELIWQNMKNIFKAILQ